MPWTFQIKFMHLQCLLVNVPNHSGRLGSTCNPAYNNSLIITFEREVKMSI